MGIKLQYDRCNLWSHEAHTMVETDSTRGYDGEKGVLSKGMEHRGVDLRPWLCSWRQEMFPKGNSYSIRDQICAIQEDNRDLVPGR